MKRLYLAAALCLAALPVRAAETLVLVRGQHVICIGENACSMATTQTCSVALGKDVQFPEGAAGNHVLVTTAGTRPLTILTPDLVDRINAEIVKVLSWGLLDPAYVDEWNAACGA